MIVIYRFLAFIDNLPDVRWVRDQELDGLKLSLWDSDITNKTVRIDVTREEITEYIALQYLTLLGYPDLITHLFPAPKVKEKIEVRN